jgi:copper(I)-binding protein
MKHFAFALLGTLALCGAAHAHSVKKDTLEIIHPHINEPFAGAKSAAAYMAISNEGSQDDRLIGIETPAAKKASLHSTEHASDGVARMTPIEAIDIPAGETINLEPGGMHIMLMGLTGPIKEGDMVPTTFHFEHAGPVAVEFMVDPADGVDHSKMDHASPSN